MVLCYRSSLPQFLVYVSDINYISFFVSSLLDSVIKLVLLSSVSSSFSSREFIAVLGIIHVELGL